MAKRGIISVGMVLQGDKELMRAFRTMTPVVQRKVLRPAISQASSIVNKQAKQNARKLGGSGALAKSIGKKIKSYNRTGVVIGSIGPRVGFDQSGRKPSKYAHLVEETVKPHVIRTTRARALAGDDWEHPVTVELGHPGSRPNPFMRMAAEASRLNVANTIKRVMRQRLPIEAAKHAQKQLAKGIKRFKA